MHMYFLFQAFVWFACLFHACFFTLAYKAPDFSCVYFLDRMTDDVNKAWQKNSSKWKKKKKKKKKWADDSWQFGLQFVNIYIVYSKTK